MLQNKKAVRDYALHISLTERNGKFKRVSKSFHEEIEGDMKHLIARKVRHLPSVGKTIMGTGIYNEGKE